MAKMLYLVPEDYGFISHRLELAKEVNSMGHDVIVVTRINNHADDIKSNGFKLIELGSPDGSRNRNILKTIFDLITIYGREKPDIVHHFTIRMVILGTIAAKLSKNIKIINTITGLGSAFIHSGFKFKIIQKLISFTLQILLPNTHVTVQNNSDYDFIEALGLNENLIHIILGSGVDVNYYIPEDKDNLVPVVMLPARMLWVKGIGEFIEAIKLLKSESIECRCILIGENDDSNPSSISNNKLLQWEKEGWVEWWGFQKDMLSALGKADIICLPSYREGLPKTLLEAASAGIPIVTTDAPGCREVVDDKVNGFLVTPKKSDEVYLALKKLILDKALREQMGKKGRQKVLDTLSSEIVVRKNIDLYKISSPDMFTNSCIKNR